MPTLAPDRRCSAASAPPWDAEAERCRSLLARLPSLCVEVLALPGLCPLAGDELRGWARQVARELAGRCEADAPSIPAGSRASGERLSREGWAALAGRLGYFLDGLAAVGVDVGRCPILDRLASLAFIHQPGWGYARYLF